LKLIEKRWGLPPLGDRDGSQADMSTNSMSFAPNAGEPTPAVGRAALQPTPPSPDDTPDVERAADATRASRAYGQPMPQSLVNRFAYIPPQCYAKTNAGERVTNSCYTCHQRSTSPNFVNDADLQLALRFSAGAAKNPWQNVIDPPVLRGQRMSETEVLTYVRQSNYFDERGAIALAAKLEALPAAWDTEGDCRWNGYVPDAWFHFDEHGFDVGPDDRDTGWRAFAYYPVPGAFVPTNGSMDDVLIRLDASLREDESGRPNRRIYETNLAIVEALITRRDVPIETVDEVELGVDLDRDGTLGPAVRVAFDALPNGDTRMRYVGRARVADPEGSFPIAPGLYPLGTEFLHSVRYLDIGEGGAVVMAPRMKELRYARKTNWLQPHDLEASVALEPFELRESPGGAHRVLWKFDRGVHNGRGWVLQGFIEATDGSLRPQSYEESVACVGCHGGIGATTDSMFALPRKVASGPAHGWFHFSQRGLQGLADPERSDGVGEYALYLRENGGGDDFHENGEVRAKFFDDRGRLRQDMLARLRDDIAEFLLPSAARALDLDRAYRAIVAEQSFIRGRDAILGTTRNVHTVAPVGTKTGVLAPR
jgi:hypothetical protein